MNVLLAERLSRKQNHTDRCGRKPVIHVYALVKAGSKRSRTVLDEVKSDGRSQQEAKTGGLVIMSEPQ